MITSQTIYICTDGHADIEIEAGSAQEAAQEYVDGGDWGERETTQWIDVYCTPTAGDEEDRELVTITLDPVEPLCDGAEGHDWQSPYEIVGGLRENPGVSGSGGGVEIVEVCIDCGCARSTDAWAQRPDTGEQGLESATYEPGRYSEEVARFGGLCDGSGPGELCGGDHCRDGATLAEDRASHSCDGCGEYTAGEDTFAGKLCGPCHLEIVMTLWASYTDNDFAMEVEIKANSLADLAKLLPPDYDGPRLKVYDDRGFVRGWIGPAGDWTSA